MNGAIVIVGAGPAGLSAAIELRRAGLDVTILDRETVAGGIPRHCGHYPFGWREFRRVMRGPDYARRLVAEAEAAGVGFRLNTTVTKIGPGPRLQFSSPEGLGDLVADRILLATGVRETPRASRLIGGTKPAGIVTVGTLQTMVYGSGLRPFRRPLILGSELVAFSALMTCAHAGIRPLAIVEPGPQVTARWPSSAYSRLRGVPVLTNCDVVEIQGRDVVTGIVLRQGGRIWRVACDGLITSGLFRPDAVVARESGLKMDERTGGPEIDSNGATSEPCVYAAGNILRPAETAGHCWAEGRSVARAIAASFSARVDQRPTAITLEGDVLRWIVPQRPGSGALANLTLRVSRPALGSIVVHGQDSSVSFGLDSRPERRITLAYQALPNGPLRLEFRGES